MKDSLYIKLDDHTEYRQSIKNIHDLLDDLDEKMSRLKAIKEKEASYIETWESKSETIRDNVEETSKLLDVNRDR